MRRIIGGVTLTVLLLSSVAMATPPDRTDANAGASRATKMTLGEVEYWGYNIQDVHTDRQYDQLTDSHFDLYVLEVVTTEKGMDDYDIGGLVYDIRQHNIDVRGVDPIILAYVDVAQAENWRWYWKSAWEIGDPEWIVGGDPNDWEGNFPVAYWYNAWEDIAIYGHQGRSHVQETLDAGFDGIYMDWVEAFSDDTVIDKVQDDFGLGRGAARDRAAELMFDFIEKIGDFARASDPDYLVVAQNASDLYEYDPDRYEDLIDGIALEAIWYDGENEDGDDDGTGAFDDWGDPEGYNLHTNDLYDGWTEEVLDDLEGMPAGFPTFCVEYAQDIGSRKRATEVYDDLAPGVCVPYASQRSLSRLSTKPYPDGYKPRDYEKPPSRPKLKNPADEATIDDTTPKLVWRKSKGYPVSYQVEIDDDADFSSPLIEVDRTKPKYVVSPALAPGTYYWRVRAEDGVGDRSKWSKGRSFTITG
jgi:cysteinyl-tRNA synthetase